MVALPFGGQVQVPRANFTLVENQTARSVPSRPLTLDPCLTKLYVFWTNDPSLPPSQILKRFTPQKSICKFILGQIKYHFVLALHYMKATCCMYFLLGSMYWVQRLFFSEYRLFWDRVPLLTAWGWGPGRPGLRPASNCELTLNSWVYPYQKKICWV